MQKKKGFTALFCEDTAECYEVNKPAVHSGRGGWQIPDRWRKLWGTTALVSEEMKETQWSKSRGRNKKGLLLQLKSAAGADTKNLLLYMKRWE